MIVIANGIYFTTRPFHLSTGFNMNMTVFWNVAPCGLAVSDQHFRGAYYMMEAERRSSEMSQCLPDYMVQHSTRQLPSLS
jgi:hypothetical protein